MDKTKSKERRYVVLPTIYEVFHLKILVRIPQWLGDAVVSTIFINRLKALNPASEIHVLVKPELAEIFETHPDVSHVRPLPKPYRWQVKMVGTSLRSSGFDAFYVLPRSLRTAGEAFFSKIPIRVGFGGDPRAFFFTKTVFYDSNLSYPRRYLSYHFHLHFTACF